MKSKKPVKNGRLRITEMPDRATVEAFLAGMHGEYSVYFNYETGKFERYK